MRIYVYIHPHSICMYKGNLQATYELALEHRARLYLLIVAIQTQIRPGGAVKRL